MTAALNKRLRAYRAQTFRTTTGRRLTRKEQAIKFVNERGFCFFWPIKDILLPSLWAAVAGNRAVADAHDDPGHVTWGWKDSALGERVWYYAKVLRHKSTMVALDVAPNFYALSENFGSFAEDYLLQYEQGLLSLEAKLVYEALLRDGAMHTIQLRRVTGMSNKESETRFNRALLELERDFKILPVGVAQAGAWRYSFICEITARYYPQLAEQARAITQSQARARLVELYLRSVGAARNTDVSKLFGWKVADIERTLARLAESGTLSRSVTLAGEPGEWNVLSELI